MSGSWRGSRGYPRGTGGTPRGSRGGYRGFRSTVPSPATDSSPDLPFGEILATIDILATPTSQSPPKIENCEYLASYNWLDRATPSIVVPGSPPKWTPPASRQRLSQDSGNYFRDPNAARYPNYPTEPAIRALFAMQPKLDTSAIDIVACGSTLGNLLRFASSQERSFRFDVDIVGGTMFFIRRERTPKDLIEDIRGYGHTFPESHTTWAADVKGSASHQRIIKYTFGELCIVVRTETDGYLDDGTQPEQPGDRKVVQTDSETSKDSELLAQLNVSEQTTVVTSEPLTIKPGGRTVPQNAIFDIKTRSARNEIDMDAVLPRLWVNQTPNFIIAYHNFGNFDDPQVQQVRPKILAWETANADILSRLRAIMQEIRDQANALELRTFEISRTGTGPLHLRRQVGAERRVMPSDLSIAWGSRGSKEGDKDEASVGSEKLPRLAA